MEYQRRIKPALELYEKMVPLGVDKLLPTMLEDAKTREVLKKVSNLNWGRWGRIFLVIGGLYGSVTLIGGSMAILRTLGILH